MDRIDLHRFRWPFAAARASAYLLMLAAFALTDPGYTKATFAATTAKPFRLYNRDIVIEVYGETLFLAGRFYRPDEISQKLSWLHEHNRHSRLVLRTSADSRYRDIRRVLTLASAAGFRRLTLETASARPFLLRRLEHPTELDLDRSHLEQPPDDEGGFFSTENLWN